MFNKGDFYLFCFLIIIIISSSAIIRELGLDDKVTVEQIAKKWENLKLKYKVGTMIG